MTAPRWCLHCGDALDPEDAPEAFDAWLCVECYDVAHYDATGWLEDDEPCPP